VSGAETPVAGRGAAVFSGLGSPQSGWASGPRVRPRRVETGTMALASPEKAHAYGWRGTAVLCRQTLGPGRAEMLEELFCHPHLPVGFLGLFIDSLRKLHRP
jgi:hypothetical protein